MDSSRTPIRDLHSSRGMPHPHSNTQTSKAILDSSKVMALLRVLQVPSIPTTLKGKASSMEVIDLHSQVPRSHNNSGLTAMTRLSTETISSELGHTFWDPVRSSRRIVSSGHRTSLCERKRTKCI
ncbi:hypothetical protein NDU88_000590 [Pleurodeles waltl]|uniref:Uncharacterized protein n=1 Tax=Pleurodeles waltl TaxID=8319 RepID=A0AAV7UTI6_PLEWA|nr:hypothetical protein NDU88_000590 [Pleurodeles waltl]